MVKVLVIDDDAATRALLERILKQQNYTVYTANCGRTGIEIALQIQPALIICDWMMEELNGLQVCQSIKNVPQLAPTFFILLTLRNSTDDCVEGLDAGADDFLAKPINSHELKARVRAGLRLHQTKQDLQTRNEALELLSQRLEQQTKVLESELSEASSYLRSLLPKPCINPIKIDSCFVPSRQLGGDLFDYFWLDQDFLMIYLLDVSGHGLTAALPAISIFNLLRSRALDRVSFYQPNQVLSALNEQFCSSNYPGDQYFTIWYGVYNQAKQQLVYASAGHPPAIFISHHQDQIKVQQFRTPGLPIGLMPDAKYVNQFCSIDQSSNLYIFSDGVYEFYQSDRTLFGIERLIDTLRNGTQQNMDLDAVFGAIRSWNCDREFQDDLSLIQLSF